MTQERKKMPGNSSVKVGKSSGKLYKTEKGNIHGVILVYMKENLDEYHIRPKKEHLPDLLSQISYLPGNSSVKVGKYLRNLIRQKKRKYLPGYFSVKLR